MTIEREVDSGSEGLTVAFSWACLTRAREDKGLSIKDVARRLKITECYIRALEEGDFKQFPATTFARGHVKNYARLLGLDADELASKVDVVGVSQASTYGERMSSDNEFHFQGPTVRSSSVVRYGVTTVLVLLVSLVSYFWWDGREDPSVTPPVFNSSATPPPATAGGIENAGGAGRNANATDSLSQAGQNTEGAGKEAVTALKKDDSALIAQPQENDLELHSAKSTELKSTKHAALAKTEAGSPKESVVKTTQPDRQVVDTGKPVNSVTETRGAAVAVVSEISEADSLDGEDEVDDELVPLLEQAQETAVAELIRNKKLASRSPQPESVQDASVSRTLFYIRFKEDCWMKVTDMSGNVLSVGLNRAGSEFEMETPGAIKVKLGNAPGVEVIRFGGETVDISAWSMKKGRKVAKLKLNANEQS